MKLKTLENIQFSRYYVIIDGESTYKIKEWELMSERIMSLIREIADEGTTIIVIYEANDDAHQKVKDQCFEE